MKQLYSPREPVSLSTLLPKYSAQTTTMLLLGLLFTNDVCVRLRGELNLIVAIRE